MRVWCSLILIVVVLGTTSAAPRSARGPVTADPIHLVSKVPLSMEHALLARYPLVHVNQSAVPPKPKEVITCAEDGMDKATVVGVGGTVVAGTGTVTAYLAGLPGAVGTTAASVAQAAAAVKFWTAVAMAGTAVTVVAGVVYIIYWAQKRDPVDLHFTLVAIPQMRPVPPVPVGHGVTPAEARAADALYANVAQMLAVSRAMVTSYNRAQGAAAAGNVTWTRRQSEATARYALREASLLDAQPGLRARLRHAWEDSRVSYRRYRNLPAVIKVSAAAIRTMQNDVARHGLQRGIKRQLTNVGVDSDGMVLVRSMLTGFHATGATALRFPDMLTDTQLDAVTRGSAAALRQFAASISQGPKVPAGIGVTAAAAGPLPATAAQPGTTLGGSADGMRPFAESAAPPSCTAPPPTGASTPTTPPSSHAGDLMQDGPITVTLPPPTTGITVDVSGAKSLNGTVTEDTPWGKATYRWTLPAHIPQTGAQGTLTLTADPGTAGARSDMEVELWVHPIWGTATIECVPVNASCDHLYAKTVSGKSDSATSTFTIKPFNHDDVIIRIGCAWNGPSIDIPYRIIQ